MDEIRRHNVEMRCERYKEYIKRKSKKSNSVCPEVINSDEVIPGAGTVAQGLSTAQQAQDPKLSLQSC